VREETGEDARQELIERRAAAPICDTENGFESAEAERDLSANLEPADLARYVSTVSGRYGGRGGGRGQAVRNSNGLPRSRLPRVCRVEPKPVFEITGSAIRESGKSHPRHVGSASAGLLDEGRRNKSRSRRGTPRFPRAERTRSPA